MEEILYRLMFISFFIRPNMCQHNVDVLYYIYETSGEPHIARPEKKALSFTQFVGESEPLLWGFR